MTDRRKVNTNSGLLAPPIRIAVFLTLLFILVVSDGYAKDYGNYDPALILTETETSSGRKHGINTVYLDRILNDLAFHAQNYPPQFDSPQDQQRAVWDIKTLSGMLNILVDGPYPSPDILLRAGLLNSIGYNLDIPGSGERTRTCFKKLFATVPSHPQGNYLYGTFLAGAGKPRDAIPYLEKALRAGTVDAAYSLGMVYLSILEQKKALEYLEIYHQHRPSDKHVVKIIEAIRSGNIKIDIGRSAR